MQKEPLTASRMATLAGCMRRHFWRYEVGLRSDCDAPALRFGSAWHRAMEARWRGLDYETALEDAVPDAITLPDELDLATLSGLLVGYYRRWPDDPVAIEPECEFAIPIDGSRTFMAAGKIDGLGTVKGHGAHVLIEHKTTSDNLDDSSDYWLRLRLNQQIAQYVLAARHYGWDIAVVFYDVTRKPEIRPRTIPVLDEAGRKIVTDAAGNRALKKDGSPRESGGDGLTVQTRLETPAEFADRLAADAIARPDFYFARREVPILDSDLAEFEVQRLSMSRLILTLRAAERRCARREQAWPRNVDARVCRGCEFAPFCLQNITVDPANPPAGLRVGDRFPELTAETKQEGR